ncbi:MAG: DNA ligase D [Hyphomicrobiales bacterium]|nr:DNA ligase D [Hyphomicrobiales bacterium]
MSGLQEYQRKRDFQKTAEPSGKGKTRKSKSSGGLYVIQKHAATRLHYDFRLEHDGVLWSWAVTRGPSLDPSEKRLAVHVEDHPLDYGDFEGTIPKGEYGGGAVIVWDNGEWIPQGDPEAGMKKGHLEFELKGNKLNGRWHLVRLKPRRGEKRDNWLLIKSDDAAARKTGDILEEAPQSVKSGLTIDEIGKNGKADVWHSKPAGKNAAKKIGAKKPPRPGKQAAMPDFVPPCLATLQTAPPAGVEWLHEVKFDGYRVQAHLSGGKAKFLTRKGLDWSDRFGKPVAEMLASLNCENAILDGEIVVLADNGISSFSALQAALSEGHTETLIYYVFDLVFLDGEDVSGEPLADRKERLADLLKPLGDAGPVRYNEHFTEPGKTMLAHACRMGLEGVVSKRADAPYRSGRGHDWIKSKCTERQEFVIAGYLPSEKTGRGLRSLIVGYHEGGELKSAGHVGTGFSAKVGDDLKKKLDGLKRKTSPLTGPGSKEKGAVWVDPRLVAEVEFRSWTADRILRHASFQGLREDKPAGEVAVEEPEDTVRGGGQDASKGTPKRASAKKGAPTSVTLTHPDKLLWPEAGITKKGLLDYYEEVWPLMRQFVVNRPLALVRAPDGVGGPRFFQKHASPGMHEKILRMADPKDGEELLYIEDFDGLAALVQNGVVEVHIWGSKVDSIEKPDQIIFDLDPDEGLGVAAVREAALDVHARLDELYMPNFVKTSGGKGFHVTVPLKPKADWDRVKGFAHDFARAMEQASPERYTATLSKKARAGRIFIDYLRNGRGSTTVAPYSSRGKQNATVSMPTDWKAMEGRVEPGDYTIGDASGRARQEKADTWRDFFKEGYTLR